MFLPDFLCPYDRQIANRLFDNDRSPDFDTKKVGPYFRLSHGALDFARPALRDMHETEGRSLELNSFQLRPFPERPFTAFPCPATSGGASAFILWR